MVLCFLCGIGVALVKVKLVVIHGHHKISRGQSGKDTGKDGA